MCTLASQVSVALIPTDEARFWKTMFKRPGKKLDAPIPLVSREGFDFGNNACSEAFASQLARNK